MTQDETPKDGTGSAEGEANAGAAPAPDSQDLDENQKPNPPTHVVPGPPSIDELNAEMERKVEVGNSIKDQQDKAHDVVPEGAPVWAGGDPGTATKLQDDTPEDYYFPTGDDPKPLVDPKLDSNADGVEDGVVLDKAIFAMVEPGAPDPATLADGPDSRREHWADAPLPEEREGTFNTPDDHKIVPAVDLGITGEPAPPADEEVDDDPTPPTPPVQPAEQPADEPAEPTTATEPPAEDITLSP